MNRSPGAESRVVLIFIDGLGLGTDDPGINPLAAGFTLGTGLPLTQTTQSIQLGPAVLVPTDAQLGVAGLPQSATGQTALLTGENAPALLGRHASAYPNARLRDLLARRGIFTRCREAGLPATFANGYSRQYWESAAAGRRRHSATTLAVMGGGIRFRGEEDFEREEALYHDITGQWLNRMGRKVPLVSPEAAAQRLANVTRQHRFTLFEHFLLDIFGHRRHREHAIQALRDLEHFMNYLLQNLDLEHTTVFIASDHGNVEDLSVSQHTVNSVPVILIGSHAQQASQTIRDLTDVAGAIFRILLPNNGNSL